VDQEPTLWSGTPSQCTNLKVFISCALVAGIGIYLSFLMEHKFDNNALEGGNPPPALPFLVLPAASIILPLLVAAWHFIRVQSIHYTLTTQRLITRNGIFSRKTDELELYRVRDFQMIQPFFYRLFGLGSIILTTADRSDPSVTIKAVARAEEIRNHIRNQVESRRSGTGVRDIEVS
jgi:uncharacterized membrane protein YdbT with pleckstrin-like domain